MAGRVVEEALAVVAAEPLRRVLEHEAGHIGQPGGEDILHAQPVQGLAAGAAAHRDRVEGQVAEHLADLAEDDGVAQSDIVVHRALGVGPRREAAAQVRRRQHHPHPGLEQHVHRGHGHLGVEPLRAAAREIEHRLRGRLRRLQEQGLVQAVAGQGVAQGGFRGLHHR